MDYYSATVSEGSDESTDAISLRVFHPSDADDVMLWATDEVVTRFCRWQTYTCREQAMAYINQSVKHPYLRAICLRNRAVGAVSVTLNSECCRAELGYILSPYFRGKGIATRAVELVTSVIFDEFPFLVRLEALVDVENQASLRVLEKVGFKREGILRKYLILKGEVRDMVMFSLLSTDHQGDESTPMSGVVESMPLCSSADSYVASDHCKLVL